MWGGKDLGALPQAAMEQALGLEDRYVEFTNPDARQYTSAAGSEIQKLF